MNSLKTILSTIALAAATHCGFSQEQPANPAAGGIVGAAADPTAAAAANFSPTRMIDMRPGEKRPLILKNDERNPYANRSPEKEKVADEGENAEEIEIRKRLDALSVTGRSRGPNGLRLLLGDIILESGRILPELLEDQSESLKVIEVTEDSLVLGWLDVETLEPTGKTMQIPYDLTASVSYALHGQPNGEVEPGTVAKRRMGVMRIGQERKKQEA